jgi:hypothetical protein
MDVYMLACISRVQFVQNLTWNRPIFLDLTCLHQNGNFWMQSITLATCLPLSAATSTASTDSYPLWRGSNVIWCHSVSESRETIEEQDYILRQWIMRFIRGINEHESAGMGTSRLAICLWDQWPIFQQRRYCPRGNRVQCFPSQWLTCTAPMHYPANIFLIRV